MNIASLEHQLAHARCQRDVALQAAREQPAGHGNGPRARQARLREIRRVYNRLARETHAEMGRLWVEQMRAAYPDNG